METAIIIALIVLGAALAIAVFFMCRKNVLLHSKISLQKGIFSRALFPDQIAPIWNVIKKLEILLERHVWRAKDLSLLIVSYGNAFMSKVPGASSVLEEVKERIKLEFGGNVCGEIERIFEEYWEGGKT